MLDLDDVFELESDFDSYYIDGFAREGKGRSDRGQFKVPLITQVEGNLWQGGCIQGVKLPEDFRYVISLFPWEQYALGPKTTRMEVTMHDSSTVPEEWQLHEIADFVNECRETGKTLVHCQAGLNRSGLIVALALIKKGMAATSAIDLLRKRSPLVLCNRAFRDWLLRLDDDA